MHWLGSFAPVPTANLTGHEEKVSVENFELLKVLGTGGEDPHPPGTCPTHRALGLLPAHPLGSGPGDRQCPPPVPGTACLDSPTRPGGFACPLSGLLLPARASRVCQHPWGLAALPGGLHSSCPRSDMTALSPALQTPSSGLHIPPLSACTSASLPWICIQSV